MILVLHHDQRVSRIILVGHVPWRLCRARTPADFQPRSLPQRVERQSTMLADDLSSRGLDRTASLPQVAGQKICEGALADETDAGAVWLVEDRQAGRMRKL